MDPAAMEMLNRIRATLWARAEGRNEGGDREVMRAVDAIVKREAPKRRGMMDYSNGHPWGDPENDPPSLR